MSKNKRKDRDTPAPLLHLYAFIATLLFCALMLLVFTAISYKSSNPTASIWLYSYISLGATSLFCGFISAKMRGELTIISGLISGAVFSLFMFLISLFFKSTAFSPSVLAIYLLFTLIAGIGGFLGGIKRTKRHRR